MRRKVVSKDLRRMCIIAHRTDEAIFKATFFVRILGRKMRWNFMYLIDYTRWIEIARDRWMMNNLWRYFTIGCGHLECLNGTLSRVSHGLIVGEGGGKQRAITLN